MCLCHDTAGAAAPSLLQQLLAALTVLAGYWPTLLLEHVPGLGLLLLQHPGLGAAEAKAVLALLAQLLQHAAADGSSGAQPAAPLPALLLLPLLQQAAFGGSGDAKVWAGHALALLPRLGGSGHCSESTAAAQLHGEAAAAATADALLHRLWSDPLQARHWLASLRLELAAPPAVDGGSRAARDQQTLDAGTLAVACALLQHPAEAVQRAALRAVVAAVTASPLLGLTLLPLLVQQLQGHVESFLSGE